MAVIDNFLDLRAEDSLESRPVMYDLCIEHGAAWSQDINNTCYWYILNDLYGPLKSTSAHSSTIPGNGNPSSHSNTKSSSISVHWANTRGSMSSGGTRLTRLGMETWSITAIKCYSNLCFAINTFYIRNTH